MFKTIQIIALIQGIFLLIVLFKKKNNYLKPTFYLLIGTITAVIMYLLGDDDVNLISHNVDIFLFDKSLFITFLFLFIKYYISKSKSFKKKDYLFFIPNIIFFIIELLEIVYSDGLPVIDIPEILVELTFLAYIIYSFIALLKTNYQKWMLYFIFPLIIIISFSILDEVLYWFHFNNRFFSIPDNHFGKYTIVIVAFLFYTIALKLVVSPYDILIERDPKKYKSSSLNMESSNKIKQELLALMENDKVYLDSKLSVQKISELLHVPRQYVSEVLNNNMCTNFQDFVNSYRVEAFVNALKEKENEHYSLLGIAKNVGFNSKTSFNTSFKKIKKMTPSEFKNTINNNK